MNRNWSNQKANPALKTKPKPGEDLETCNIEIVHDVRTTDNLKLKIEVELVDLMKSKVAIIQMFVAQGQVRLK